MENQIVGDNVMNYEFKTKQGKVTISMEDVEQNPKFRIQGPKKLIAQAIAGIGEENDTEAWATEEHLKTESQRMYAVLETLKNIKDNQ